MTAYTQSRFSPGDLYGSTHWDWSYCPSHPLLRPKLLPVRHSEGGARQGQAAATIRARDGEHPGPRPGTLEAQVCLLDPGAARGGQGGREGALGCADGEPGVGYMGTFTVDQIGLVGVDAESINEAPLYPYVPVYERHHEEVMGEEVEAEDDRMGVRRCFNCGSPGHMLSGCEELFNGALVALSRQMFDFYRGGLRGPLQRIHEAEAQRHQRLLWLDEFEPGQIRGALLREALGLREEDPGKDALWLRRISVWGYPPGWVGEHDPREDVWEIITEGPRASGESCDFTIFGEGTEEYLVLPGDTTAYIETQSIGSETLSTSSVSLRRWATYPDTYFQWQKLPVYKGHCLPVLNDHSPVAFSSTFSDDRQALWESILAGNPAPHARPAATLPSSNHILPWRVPDMFAFEWTATESVELPPQLPPPPPTSPPPLPPMHPSPRHASSPIFASDHLQEESSSDDDMDLSD
ncbi:hypothetical protein C8Q79DRAFT_636069 [Trametes meyenii]|nr:hypothetical protein C8Q79DRAFT_636069 [Trametes meyenii]